jgi:NTE family protein
MGKIAFVLSGGANRGALEVGALQSLIAHSVRADLVVGTSAGALNGAYYAGHPTAEGMNRLAQIWIGATREAVFPGNPLTMALRALFGKDSLVDGSGLRDLVERSLSVDSPTFRDLQIPFYAVTADIVSATTIVFGDDLDTPLVVPVLASASFPIVLPPIEYDGFQLTDGGVTAVVPIEVALQRGTTELYVVDLEPPTAKSGPLHGILPIALQTLVTSLREQLLDDLRDVIKAGATLHHVNITAFPDLDLFDFTKMQAMIDAGRSAMATYLDAPKPNTICPLPPAQPQVPRRMPRGGRPLHP